MDEAVVLGPADGGGFQSLALREHPTTNTNNLGTVQRWLIKVSLWLSLIILCYWRLHSSSVLLKGL